MQWRAAKNEKNITLCHFLAVTWLFSFFLTGSEGTEESYGRREDDGDGDEKSQRFWKGTTKKGEMMIKGRTVAFKE